MFLYLLHGLKQGTSNCFVTRLFSIVLVSVKVLHQMTNHHKEAPE